MTEEEVAIRVRNLITEQSPAAVNITIPRIIAAIPTFLETWGYTVTASPDFSRYTYKTYNIVLDSNGRFDLTPYVDSTTAKIRIDFLRHTPVFLVVMEFLQEKLIECVWKSSHEDIVWGGIIDHKPCIYLLNNLLMSARNGNLTDLASSTLRFTIESIPRNVAEIPTTLEKNFITGLAAFIGGGQDNAGGSN